jgi:hypothetical protein
LKIASTKEGEAPLAAVVLFVLQKEFKLMLRLSNEDNV